MHVEPVPPEQAHGLAAAGRTFYSKVLQAMDAEPDEELAATNDLWDLIELRPGIG